MANTTPSTLSVIQSIKSRDWHSANEGFAGVMQQKVTERLQQERRNIASPARLKEETLPSSEVQRVFDETRDVHETATLCGVRDVRVNDQGHVISYKSL